MEEERTLIVRVNYSIVDKVTENIYKKPHIITANNQKVSKYLIGGGYCNKYGGSFTFKARNLNEAKSIADNNVFVKNKPCKYEMLIMDERTLMA